MTTAAAVREKPVLFSGEMVRAILDGRKTQTRRVVKFPRAILEIEGGVILTAFDRMQDGFVDGPRAVFDFDGEPNSFSVRNPYGAVGDHLWVRETWRPRDGYSNWDLTVTYAADGAVRHIEDGEFGDSDWRMPKSAAHGNVPSIFMPRWASRVTREITGVRVERLQDITAADCIAEGIPSRGLDRDGPNIASALMYIDDYRTLWDSLNAKRGYGWSVNPYVWVIEFKNADSAPRSGGA